MVDKIKPKPMDVYTILVSYRRARIQFDEALERFEKAKRLRNELKSMVVQTMTDLDINVSDFVI